MLAMALSRGRRVSDAAFLELVGEHQPEGGVILVAGIVGGAALAIAQDIDDAVFVERQTQRRLDHRAHVRGHVAAVETATPRRPLVRFQSVGSAIAPEIGSAHFHGRLLIFDESARAGCLCRRCGFRILWADSCGNCPGR
jgi:hypothetical protein